MDLESPQPIRCIRLIRHGKSAVGGADHLRPLNDRGKRNGIAMAGWLSGQDNPVEWVWSSTATRAASTAEYVASAYGIDPAMAPELYLADAETLLDCLRGTPGHITSVALVAHNPGITHCVNLLSPHSITDNLVTFAVAAFAYQGEWADLAFGNTRFIRLDSPKSLFGPSTEIKD